MSELLSRRSRSPAITTTASPAVGNEEETHASWLSYPLLMKRSLRRRIRSLDLSGVVDTHASAADPHLENLPLWQVSLYPQRRLDMTSVSAGFRGLCFPSLRQYISPTQVELLPTTWVSNISDPIRCDVRDVAAV